MTASFIKDQPYLTEDRVDNLSLLCDFVVCPLCHGILWLPVACETCETPYCTSCIKVWQIETSEPTRCPNNCSKYIQRKCPPANARALNKLQVACRYKLNGCTEAVPYNSLETHEEACGYRLLLCSGCADKIIKKDFRDHYNNCSLVSLTCSECATVYQRQNEQNHTETICLRFQLHQLRDQVKQNEDKWNDKLKQNEDKWNDKLNQMNTLIEKLKIQLALRELTEVAKCFV